MKTTKILRTTATVLCLTIGLFLLLSLNTKAQSRLIVSLNAPTDTIDQQSLNLGFSVLDIDNETITAECYKKDNVDLDFILFQSVNIEAGGNNGTCNIDSSIINKEGSYDFKVIATTNLGSSESEVVRTTYVKPTVQATPEVQKPVTTNPSDQSNSEVLGDSVAQDSDESEVVAESSADSESVLANTQDEESTDDKDESSFKPFTFLAILFIVVVVVLTLGYFFSNRNTKSNA